MGITRRATTSRPAGWKELTAERGSELGHAFRDDVVGRMARRLRRMTSDVADREAALRAEIAALRAEVERARTGTDNR